MSHANSCSLTSVVYFAPLSLVFRPSSVPQSNGLNLLLATENFYSGDTFWQIPVFSFLSTLFAVLPALFSGSIFKMGSLCKSKIEEILLWHKSILMFPMFTYLGVSEGPYSPVKADRHSMCTCLISF